MHHHHHQHDHHKSTCLRVRFIAIAMYSVYSIALMETITKITINTSSTWLMVIDWQM